LWLLVILGVAPAVAKDRIGDIEFFGYKGIDVTEIRRTLPVHEGDEYSDRTKGGVRRAVAAITGKEPTDVAAICCDEKGDRLLFIGLLGGSNKGFTYNPEAKGSVRLPSSIIEVYGRLDQALEAAVRSGGQAAEEDDSNG